METGLENCKKCMLYELADKAAYESVKNYIDALSPEQRIDDTEYHKRLEICRNCDMFLAAMCRKCGCYVEVRAIRPDSHCPKVKACW
ncbi:MAG: hypothetical protein J5824_06855 [Lachnospiraceae bacterium]|nr:hypothetical protein [Lachnospiraceae bacterium]